MQDEIIGKIYASVVKKKAKTIDEVPEELQEEVKKILGIEDQEQN